MEFHSTYDKERSTVSCEGWVLRRGVLEWRDFTVRALKNVKVIYTLNTTALYKNVLGVHHST